MTKNGKQREEAQERAQRLYEAAVVLNALNEGQLARQLIDIADKQVGA